MADKKTVVLGKTAYEMIVQRRYHSDDPSYDKTLDALNIVLSDGALYRAKDGEFHLYLNHLYGAFILKSDRFTGRDFFAVTFKENYVPNERKKSDDVTVEWTGM